jgi:hypothetical protein
LPEYAEMSLSTYSSPTIQPSVAASLRQSSNWRETPNACPSSLLIRAYTAAEPTVLAMGSA